MQKILEAGGPVAGKPDASTAWFRGSARSLEERTVGRVALTKSVAALGLPLLLAAVSCPSIAGPRDETVKGTFAGAVTLIERAGRTPSLEERWAHYEMAHAYLRRIVSLVPEADLVRRLRRGETVGGINYEDIGRTLLRTGKAVCEQDFTAACVLRLAVDTSRVMYSDPVERLLLAASAAQAEAGDVAGAFATAEELSSDSFREAIQPIMRAMVKSGELAGALSRAHGLRLRPDRDAVLLAIVLALAEGGEVTSGRDVAGRIADTRQRALALAALARGSKEGTNERTEFFAKSAALADSVDGAAERASALFEIARLRLDAGRTAAARKTITKALAAAELVADVWERSGVLRTALQAFSSPEILAADPTLVDELRESVAHLDEAYGPATYALDEVQARFKIGDVGGGKALLERTRSAALDVESTEDREFALQRVIRLRAEIGDIDGALADWLSLRTPKWVELGRQDIARAQSKAGDVEGLRRLMERIEPDWRRDQFLRWHVVPALAENGRTAQARAFVQEIVESDRDREEAMVAVAKGEAALGNFNAALTTARSLRHAQIRARAFREIAAEHLRRNELDEAKALLREAFNTVFGAGIIFHGDRILWSSHVTDTDVPDAETLIEIGVLLVKAEASR